MDKIVHLSLLFDFYGSLLTERQKQVFEMYYQNDLSLSEISYELSISRQGVNDILKRTVIAMQHYESHLNLIDKFYEQNKITQNILDSCENIVLANNSVNHDGHNNSVNHDGHNNNEAVDIINSEIKNIKNFALLITCL